MEDHKIIYKYYYDIAEEPRIIKYSLILPLEQKNGVISWNVEYTETLLGTKSGYEPKYFWESEFNWTENLQDALSELSTRVETKIAWLQGQILLAKNQLDLIALSDLWTKEEIDG